MRCLRAAVAPLVLLVLALHAVLAGRLGACEHDATAGAPAAPRAIATAALRVTPAAGHAAYRAHAAHDGAAASPAAHAAHGASAHTGDAPPPAQCPTQDASSGCDAPGMPAHCAAMSGCGPVAATPAATPTAIVAARADTPRPASAAALASFVDAPDAPPPRG